MGMEVFVLRSCGNDETHKDSLQRIYLTLDSLRINMATLNGGHAMSRHQITPFPVRMPAELKSWLQQRATQNFRSMNNELLALLMDAQKREQAHEKAA